MPLIHHVALARELEVSEQAAEILTTNPRVPWKRGPLPTRKTASKPTAAPQPTPDEGDQSLTEEV